jgi:hypothetical protein
MSDLEARIRRLEDIEAIRALKARYCNLADRGFNGAGHDDEAFASLFTDDGVFEGSAGPLQGRAAIRERARAFHPLSMHLVMNPEIEVDGDRRRPGARRRRPLRRTARSHVRRMAVRARPLHPGVPLALRGRLGEDAVRRLRGAPGLALSPAGSRCRRREARRRSHRRCG